MDLPIGTTAEYHDFPLDAASPPSAPIDRAGTVDYVKANLSTVHVAQYDQWGFYVAMKVTQSADAGVANTWSPSPLQVYAHGLCMGAQAETDPDLQFPLTATNASTANVSPHLEHQCVFRAREGGATGSKGLADGSNAAAAKFGFYSTGARTIPTTDNFSVFIWIGSTPTSSIDGAIEGLPRVSTYDELKLTLHWLPTFTGAAIVTQPRVKMKIWGVGVIT